MAAVRMLSLPGASETEGAGIPWVVDHPEHARVTQLSPHHIPFARSSENTARKLQPLLTKLFDGRRCRTGTSKGAKELANALLDAHVRIDAALALAVVDITDRQANLQFSAACFVEDTAAKPRAQDMQLRFTHRAFETEQ